MAEDQVRATDKWRLLGLERADGPFWVKWVLATVVGGAVGGTVGGLVGGWVDEALGVFAGPAVGWAVVGIGQWLALRKRVDRSGWWVLATAVGGLVGGLVGGAVDKLAGGAVGALAGGAAGLTVSWTAVGTAQWLVLRKHVPRSGQWVLVTAVGGPVGLVVGAAMGAFVGLSLSLVVGALGLMPHNPVGFADLGALAWTMGAVLLTSGTMALLVCGAIGAFGMLALLRHPSPKDMPVPPTPR